MAINVSFKVTGGKEFTIAFEPNITVLELKKKCSEHVDIPVEAQRIIFKGKILKDKESLSSYNVSDGITMHLVRSSIPTKEPQPEKESTSNNNENVNNEQNPNPNSSENINNFSDNPLVQMLLQSGTGDVNNSNAETSSGDNMNFANFANMLNPNGGDFNRDTIASLLNNPLARSLLNELSSNPEMLTNLVLNNPVLRNTFSQNAMMQPVLENPNLLREFMRPEILQAGLQFENALNGSNSSNNNSNNNNNTNNNTQRRLRMEDLLNNFSSFTNNNTNDNNNNNNANENNSNNNLNSLFQSPELLQTFQQVMRANRNLPNLNFSNTNQNLGFNLSNTNDSRTPEEIYASQLSSLQEMGFIDNAANIQALQETGGDVNSAVTRLLEKGFN